MSKSTISKIVLIVYMAVGALGLINAVRDPASFVEFIGEMLDHGDCHMCL